MKYKKRRTNSVQPRDRIFVKDYGILSFAKSMGKDIDHAKQSAKNAFKTTSRRVIPKTAEATGDLIGNKIANKIRRVSKTSQHNNSETVTNEHNKEIPKERYISLEQRQKNIDDLRLI